MWYRCGILSLATGVVGSRWAPRSSKPVAGRSTGRGGFDSHPLPPFHYTGHGMEKEDHISYADISKKLLHYVSDVMDVLDVTSGGEQEGYAIRFRGTLSIDSEEAFRMLDPLFVEYDMTLLFREEGADQFIIGMPGTIPKKRSNPWINLILFLLTVFSMLIAGTLYGYEGSAVDDFGQLLTGVFHNLALTVSRVGTPFAEGGDGN